MALQRIGMLGVSVRKMKALTVKVETVILIDKAKCGFLAHVLFLYEFGNNEIES
jgi:hypothetical protein